MVKSDPSHPPSSPRSNAGRLLSFVYPASFEKDWAAHGLDDDDRRAVERAILANPTIGPVMAGTGGLRKFRFAPEREGRGKSGAYRVCYALFPVPGLALMVALFGKNEKDNLSQAERAAIRAMLADYGARLEGRGV